MLVDAHCHLADPVLAGDLEGLLARARQAGVGRLLTCATGPADWALTLEMAGKHDGVRPALGFHPWFLDEATPASLARLEALLASHPRALVGEIGLDALRDAADDRACQTLAAQIRLAKKHRRPFVLHAVRAWGPLLEVLRGESPLGVPFMLHAYSGSAELMQELAGMGGYFSFAASITNPANRRAIKALEAVRLDRLLIETDSPDFLPAALRGIQPHNEPANLPLVFEATRTILKKPKKELEDILEQNCVSFGSI